MGEQSIPHDAGPCQPDLGNAPRTKTPTTPPPPPNPSADPKLPLQAKTPPSAHCADANSASKDLFMLSPVAALRLLAAGIEALVRITGDIPPTPPLKSPPIPNMSGIHREKADIVRVHSEKSLARMAEQAQKQEEAAAFDHQAQQQQQDAAIDGVRLRHVRTPPPPHATPEPYLVIGANSQPLNLQHSAITRKFYSKAPPPISIEDYLLRIHQFCPMSTAVYLATSFYMFRLAVDEKAIPVTRRNCHRLLLAGLRVAMKALEDLCYPHWKIARVGGVSEAELARLEISFCFLAGFELVVTEESLKRHWDILKSGSGMTSAACVPVFKLEPMRKALSAALMG